MRCGVPNQFAGHKSLRAKRDRGMNSRESAFIFTETGELYPVGTREYMHFPSYFELSYINPLTLAGEFLTNHEGKCMYSRVPTG